MTPRYKAVKGTRDVFPPESDRFAEAERIAREVFSSYGYGEVRTPCLEPTELFAQIMEHRWYLSEQAGRDVGLAPAVQSYLADVLAHRPDEQAILGYALDEGALDDGALDEGALDEGALGEGALDDPALDDVAVD